MPATPPLAIEEPPIKEDDTKPRTPVDYAPAGRGSERAEPGYDYGPPGPPGGEPPDEYYDDEEGGPPLISWRPIVTGTIVAAIILIILALLAGAGVDTPTAPAAPTATATNTLAPLPTDTPTSTATATPTATEEPSATPTETYTPTPEFCCVTVLEGDTLIPIVGRCGHLEWQAVAGTVVAINDNVQSQDLLPPPGAEICVPWPTPVGGAPPEPPPEGGEGGDAGAVPEGQAVGAVATATGAGEEPPPQPAATETPLPPPTDIPITLSLRGLASVAQAPQTEASPTATPTVFLQEYTVRSGDTMIGVAYNANTDVAMLATLNPQLDWSSCNFSNPGGGPGCNPPLFENQRLSVPAPTYTPTLSPTPSGSETPTPTPTPYAPVLLSPADGARFGPDGVVVLRWVPIGVLRAEETYLVHVEDQDTGNVYELRTRLNQSVLPAQARPADGRAHTFMWTVVVAREGEDVDVLSGPRFEVRSFTWNGG